MEIHPSLLFFLTILLMSSTSSMAVLHDNFTDLSALLAFKANLFDPQLTLASNWTPNTSFCFWIGVSCSLRRQRVTALNLTSFSLQGTISPHLSNLSFISFLDLSKNTLLGSIPDALGQLPRLQILILESNHLSGSIPLTIFNMSSLIILSLAKNNLSGPLLTSNHTLLSFLPSLQLISLSYNQFTGHIPSIFAMCPVLQKISFSYNQFTGNIPLELPHKLNLLYLSNNDLSGNVPISLANLTMINQISLGFNSLTGVIPSELGSLVNLQKLKLTSNQLIGSIPISLSNLSMLGILELANNSLTGSVLPNMFSNMPNLNLLSLGGNQLTGSLNFITPLSNCRILENLSLWGNKFEGVIPKSIGNLSSQILRFTIYQNHIQGIIPDGFGNLTSLLELDLSDNKLEGTIPKDLTRLEMIQQILMAQNRLDGSIPHELGQMRNLGLLYLSYNNLSGSIPNALGNISGLQQLLLSTNTLSSSIPPSIWSLTGLRTLDLSSNILSGNLPRQVGNLSHVLDLLDLSTNQLSGSIPIAFGDMQMLEYLDLSHNLFLGTIPDSLGRLFNLKDMNLSSNALSGAIPNSLANLNYLATLNLSFNKLEGEIPKGGLFHNLSSQSFIGNLALCGAPHLGFPPCVTKSSSSHSRVRLVKLLKFIIPVMGFVLLLVACMFFILAFQRRRKMTLMVESQPLNIHEHRLISYHELLRATQNFNEGNLLGRGSFSSVFKGCLDDGLLVAVKVLNMDNEGASQSFDMECRALCMARHRNLVKIINTCSNLDFKALILQFMPNGSLEKWLYSHTYWLSLIQRICIMLDVALAMEYLHDQHVVHCDLKPSNVLLDEDMTAHVGDFGIAKLLLGDHSMSVHVSMSAPGTIGYMAPEYGLAGRVSRKADVYSYGIMLLETFTRKKPTDAMFGGESSSLREWVSMGDSVSILEKVDRGLFEDEYSDEKAQNLGTSAKSMCLVSVIKLGLSCSHESPKERISMKDAVARLEKIRENYMLSCPGSV